MAESGTSFWKIFFGIGCALIAVAAIGIGGCMVDETLADTLQRSLRHTAVALTTCEFSANEELRR